MERGSRGVGLVQQDRGLDAAAIDLPQPHDAMPGCVGARVVHVDVAVVRERRIDGHSQQPALEEIVHLEHGERLVAQLSVNHHAQRAGFLGVEQPAVGGPGQGHGEVGLRHHRLDADVLGQLRSARRRRAAQCRADGDGRQDERATRVPKLCARRQCHGYGMPKHGAGC